MTEDYIKMFSDYGIELTDTLYDKLEVYYERLITVNESFNLTTVTERDRVYKLHFLDSLLALEAIPEGVTLCDVGSGAGFPGLVLALFRPDMNVTLMDSLGKRVNFLTETAEKLGLQNVKAVHIRAEDAGKGAYRSSFDIVTGRAVARLDILAEYCLPLCKKNGSFIAYKTDEEELKLFESALRELGGKKAFLRQFVLPDGEKRCIIGIKKAFDTPAKYPRSGNKPRISPLGGALEKK